MRILLVLVLLLAGCKDKEPTPVFTPEEVIPPIIVVEVVKEDPEIIVIPEPIKEIPPTKVPASRFTAEYDKHFIKYTKDNLPFWDWQWLKAQCYQESLLKHDAVSPVGAMGLCQFMPGTWKEVNTKLKRDINTSAFDPVASIEYASVYNASLVKQWSSKRPEPDRRNLVFASYNAGLGNLLKAQKKCDNKTLYNEIIACLPDITGHHSKETITYVTRINKWFIEMQFE